jgi:hypothetical protein
MASWKKTIDAALGVLLWYMSPLAKIRLSTKIADEPEFCVSATHGREGPVEPFECGIVSVTSCLSFAS